MQKLGNLHAVIVETIIGLQENPVNWPSSRDYLEVYVSAVENAGHFWVQFLSSKAIQLDRLIENMTIHYTSTDQVRFLVLLLWT